MSLCQCGCGEPAPIAQHTHSRLGHVRGQPIRYVHGHNARRTPEAYREEDCGYKTPCWVWLRHTNESGYGMLTDAGRARLAHRTYYERAKGSVPEGLDLDHLCFVPLCVNPDHMEPVTRAENVRRGWRRRWKADVSEGVGGALRRFRLEHDLCQREMAEILGVAQTTVSAYERGAFAFQPERLEELAA